MRRSEEVNDYQHNLKSLDSKMGIHERDQKDVLSGINQKIESGATAERRQRASKLKYYVSLSAAAIIMILLAGPLIEMLSDSRHGDLTENESILGIMGEKGYDELLYVEETQGGAVVFYTPDIETDDNEAVSEMGAAFLARNLFGWRDTHDGGVFTGSASEDISMQLLPGADEQSPFPMIYGEIRHADISRIQVTDSRSQTDTEAEIVTTDGHEIWFVFVESSEEYQVQGLSEAGDVIADITVNADGIETSDLPD